jgi:response regulator RpfG family c-di-GMP phosphodiesterase
LGLDSALEEIGKHRGTLYDPDVVDVFVSLVQEKRFSLNRWRV